jgi:hypothetical protein
MRFARLVILTLGVTRIGTPLQAEMPILKNGFKDWNESHAC